MELYQRVWAEQFVLTAEQKAEIKTGKEVKWNGETIRHNGAEKFHVLLQIGEFPKPLFENQWLVRREGHTEVMWDHDVKSRFLFSQPAGTAEAPREPYMSPALERFLKEREQKAVAESELPKAEPAVVAGPNETTVPETFENLPVYDAQPNGHSADPVGQTDQTAEVASENDNSAS